MRERDAAFILANSILDKRDVDPDGDLSLLARQFLRSLEREQKLEAEVESLKLKLEKANDPTWPGHTND